MIGEGPFNTQLREIEAILKKLKLFAERQRFPNTSLGAAVFRGKTYREVYDLAFKELAFNFRLTDQSLLFFKKSGTTIHDGSLSFIYYEAPVAVMSYELFLSSEFGLDPTTVEFEKMLKECGDEWLPDYEQYVRASDLKQAVTPLRYDCKAEDYRAGIHPAAHMHFGVENNIRLGSRRVMGPLGFTLFILRQHYPSSWQEVLDWPNCEVLCRQFRTALDEVDAAYWRANDERELHLA